MHAVRTPGVSPHARGLALLAGAALVAVGLAAGATPAAAQESCPDTEGAWIAEVAAGDSATMTVAAPSKMLIVETCVEVAGDVVRASYSPGEPRVTVTSPVSDDAGSIVPISRVSYRLEMRPTTPGACPPDLSLCPPAIPDPAAPDPTVPDPEVPATPETPAPVAPTTPASTAGATPAATAPATGLRRPTPQVTTAAPAPATPPDAATAAAASSAVTPSAVHRTAVLTAAAPVTREVSLAEAHASVRATDTARSALAAGGAGIWGLAVATLLAAGAASGLVARRRLVAAGVPAAD